MVHKKRTRSHFGEALGILLGTVIGAGVLGIPYAIAKSGFILGLVDIILLGSMVLFLNLCVGEISLRTKKNHMLAGYAEKYLGKWAKHLLALTTVFGIYGALVIYTLGEGQVLSAIFGGTAFNWSVLFFIFFAFLLYFKLEVIAESELLMSGAMIALLVALIVLGFSHVNVANLQSQNLSNLFFPYGIIFFAFLGASAIPEMREELRSRPKELKNAILFGGLIVMVLYALFALVAVGVTGINTTEVATIGLGNVLGEKLLLLGNLFAVFSMASSFLILGMALKWMLKYDYGISWKISWLIAWIVPLIIFLSVTSSFASLMGLTGAITGGIEGIILVLTAMSAKKHGERRPEYTVPLNWFLAIVLILLFLGGIAYQFVF